MSFEDFLNYAHELDRSRLRKAVEEALSGLGGASVEHRLTDNEGDARFVRQEIELTSEPLPRLQGTIQDISSRKDAEERIRQLAYFDSVTGLANRTLLIESLDQALDEAEEAQQLVAVIFLDLDLFKKVNDTIGHDAGDELLRQVGGRLRQCLRPTDTVSASAFSEWEQKSVARLGGG